MQTIVFLDSQGHRSCAAAIVTTLVRNPHHRFNRFDTVDLANSTNTHVPMPTLSNLYNLFIPLPLQIFIQPWPSPPRPPTSYHIHLARAKPNGNGQPGLPARPRTQCQQTARSTGKPQVSKYQPLFTLLDPGITSPSPPSWDPDTNLRAHHWRRNLQAHLLLVLYVHVLHPWMVSSTVVSQVGTIKPPTYVPANIYRCGRGPLQE